MQNTIHVPIVEVSFRACFQRSSLYVDKQLLEREQRVPDFRNVVCVAIYTKTKLKKKITLVQHAQQ